VADQPATEPAGVDGQPTLTAQYEQLRQVALGGHAEGWRHGLGVLATRGMSGWMNACRTVAPAPAAQPTPGTGALGQQQNSFKGHLAAGTGGHFALYEFNYPGNRAVYTINMQVSPDNPAGLQHSGFKVYGPVKDKVYVECYLGDDVALSNHTTGALMKLANYPEPPLRFWVPELSVGLFCLAVWVSLYLWRRHLFATLVVRSTR